MNFGDLTGLFGKIKDMQANMQQMQEELAKKLVSASSGGGMVTATVNGKGDLQGIKIDRQVVNVEDVEMLEDLVTAAVNAAVEKSRDLLKEEMKKMTGGMDLPGLGSLSNLLG